MFVLKEKDAKLLKKTATKLVRPEKNKEQKKEYQGEHIKEGSRTLIVDTPKCIT